MRSRACVLREVIASIDRMTQSLQCEEEDITTIPKASASALPDLGSLSFRCQSLYNNLQSFPIRESVRSSLVQLAEKDIRHFIGYVNREWSDLSKKILRHGQLSCSGVHSLRAAFMTALQDHRMKVEKTIIAVVEERSVAFKKHAKEQQISDSTSEDEESRGHSKLAVTILEQAYSYSTNITTAERNKLAEATKLSRKQVTIWFQNRRNRRTSLKRKYLDDHVQRCRLPETDHKSENESAVAANSTTSSSASLTSSVDTSCSMRDERQECGSSGNSYDDTLPTSFLSSSDDLYQRSLHDVSESCSEWMIPRAMGSDKFIFNDLGPQLDFDDLELDIEDLKSGLLPHQLMFDPRYIASEPASAFGKTRLTHPLSEASGHPRNPDVSKAELFASVLADELDKQIVPAQVASELDFFLSGLELDKIMAENYRTFYGHEAGDSLPFDSLGDLGLQTG